MKNRIIMILFISASFSKPVFAQTNLQEQIKAVDDVQSQIAADNDRHDAKIKAERIAVQKAKDEERLKDKVRDQSYEDKLRDVQLEAQKTQLDVMKAKANRANDYIDQDLNREKAKTDVIQSQADATRNISQGTREIMHVSNKETVKESWWSKWFK